MEQTVFDPGDNQNPIQPFISYLPERSKFWKWKQEDESTLNRRNTLRKQSMSLPNIEVEAVKSSCTLAYSIWWTTAAYKFPSVVTQQPFSPTHNNVRIKILQLNSVISIGVSDSRFKMNSSKVVGLQKQGFNCALCWNISKPISICYNGTPLQNCYEQQSISANDVLEIKLNYTNNTIHFIHNEKETGVILSKRLLSELEIFPCVSMQPQSAVLLVDESKIEKKSFDLVIPKEPLSRESSENSLGVSLNGDSKSKNYFRIQFNKKKYYNGEKGFGYIICGKKHFIKSKVKEVNLHFIVSESYRYQCEAANWRYTCGEKNALLEQKISLWKLKETKKQVPSLFYLCSNIVIKKYDIKKLNLPEEVKEKIKFEVWPFNFQIPFGFPASFNISKAYVHYSFCVSLVTELHGSFIFKNSPPKVKDVYLQPALIQTMTYFPPIPEKLRSITAERIRSKPYKLSTSLTMQVSFTDKFYYVNDTIPFSVELTATVQKKKRVTSITASLIQSVILLKKYDVPFCYYKNVTLGVAVVSLKPTFPPKSQVKSPSDLKLKLDMQLVFKPNEAFIPSYQRSDSGIEVAHMVFVRAAIKGGTDIVSRLPVTLLHNCPSPEIESVLMGERPQEIDRNIPTKRTIEGYYAKEYNTDSNTVFIM